MSFFSGLLGPIGTAVGTFFGGPAGGAIGGSIGSALGGTIGANETNAANSAATANSNAFNAEQAQLNRNFQADQTQKVMNYDTQMSSTSWQRGVADMKAAGLNPMLAYSQGGASTPTASAPSGSTANAVAPIPKINVQQAALSSAQQAATVQNTLKQGDLLDAQVEQTKADTIKSISSAKNLDADTVRVGMDTDRLQKASMLLSSQNLTEQNRASLLAVQKQLAETDTQLRLGQIDSTEAMKRNLDAQTKLTQLMQTGQGYKNTLSAYDIPGAAAQARKDSSFWGQYISPWLPSFGETVHSGAAAVRAMK